YDLVVTCLVDEHLADVAPLYREAWRLARPGGELVLVGFHPHYTMASGIPTHFDSATGEPIAIETHVHLLSEHVTAGLAAGWMLEERRERVIDDTWLALKPKWASLRGHPVTFAMAWRKPARAGDRSRSARHEGQGPHRAPRPAHELERRHDDQRARDGKLVEVRQLREAVAAVAEQVVV